ncbi:hypothetical protein AAMO2058_000717500 [Amorphochlora amoebiformis]
MDPSSLARRDKKDRFHRNRNSLIRVKKENNDLRDELRKLKTKNLRMSRRLAKPEGKGLNDATIPIVPTEANSSLKGTVQYDIVKIYGGYEFSNGESQAKKNGSAMSPKEHAPPTEQAGPTGTPAPDPPIVSEEKDPKPKKNPEKSSEEWRRDREPREKRLVRRHKEEMKALWAQLREKKAKITLLQQHFEQLRLSFRAEKQIQKQALEQLKRQKRQLVIAQQKMLEYSRRLKHYETQAQHLAALEAMLADAKAEKEELEKRLEALHLSALRGDRLEEKRIEDIVNKYRTKLTAAEEKMKQALLELEKLRAEARALKVRVEDEKESAEKHRLLYLQTQDALLQANQTIGELRQRLAAFEGNGDNKVDVEDLQAALEIIRRGRDNPSYVLGIDQGRKGLSMIQLKRELNQLEGRYNEVRIELKAKRDLVLIQQRNAKDLQSKVAAQQKEIESLKVLLAEAKRRETLGLQVDAKKDTDDISVASSMFSVTPSLFRARETALDVVTRGIVREDVLSSGPLGALENVLSIRILHGRFRPEVGVVNDPMLSCVVVEFLGFSPAFSNVLGGISPNYGLTVQYRMEMDAKARASLRDAKALVEVLVQEDEVPGLDPNNQLRSFGRAQLSLSPLLFSEAGAVAGRATVFSDGSSEKDVGSVSYQIAALWPLMPLEKAEGSADEIKNVDPEIR